MENVIKKQASRRKYHYIYKTTCIITNRFYIGMHSTDNLEDGYVGSGKRLWHSINKHGKENHVCEILEFLPDRKSLAEREKEIVNIEMLNEKLCMNLALGGEGGFSSIEHELKFKESSKKNQGFKNTIHSKRNDKLFWEQYKKNVSLGLKNAFKNGSFIPYNWSGKSHTDETKQKIGEANSIKQKGENNSQYGKCWITNEIESKKIYKGDIIPEGWRLGRKIK
jgi:hypothetical protein